ncbi:MAG: FlaA1/EpsC-like NDP-sugar epimerase [Verrucomicrobiales bacterium]
MVRALRSFRQLLGSRSFVIRRSFVFAWHVVGIITALVLSFLLRFDFQYAPDELTNLTTALPIALSVFIGVILIFRLYSGIWTYFSFSDCVRYIYALGAGTALLGFLIFAVNGFSFGSFPRSVLFINYLLLLTWEIGGRMGARFIKEQWVDPSEFPGVKENRVLIIGAHNELDHMMRSLRRAVSTLGRVVGLVSEFSHNQTIRGIRILGPVEEVGEIAWQYDVDLILILPPYNRPQRLREIVDRCAKAKVNCKFRQVPSVQDIANGTVGVVGIKNVGIEDLLPRDEFEFDPAVLSDFVGGRTVMVTGGGGSIGAELCRQVLTLNPARLIVMDHSEFALFEATTEFRSKFPEAQILPIAGDVRNDNDIERAFAKAGEDGHVDVIYHAAAYKHVHLMEENPVSAVSNNILGSEMLATKAIEHGVEHLVLVSTDKAVRPTSVMGASKRIAERLLLERARGGTRIVAVRFGNVLGSSGSVIPIFKRQIEKGGPVTVTTPETRRFFMTIPEAVHLLMIAGAVGEDRQVLVLEMGEPVKIVDLARRLIELSGFKPDDDIKIEYVGLRPGEKEFEELMTADENLVRTSYGKIWTFAKKENVEPLPAVDLQRIKNLVESCDAPALRELMKAVIPDHRFDLVDINSARNVTASASNSTETKRSLTETTLLRLRKRGA